MTILRALLVTLPVATSLATTAHAADLVVEVPAAVEEYDSSYDWSGGYIGAQVGYAWGEFDHDFPLDPTVELDDEVSGAFGGAFAGANAQFGAFVLGVDGDLNYADIAGTGDNPNGESLEVNLDWTGSLRAKAGFAADKVLVYAAAGIAGAAVNTQLFDPIGLLFSEGDEVLWGWTAGVGVDVAFDDNWFGRAEYRYNDYGSIDIGSLPESSIDVTTQTVSLGLGYRF